MARKYRIPPAILDILQQHHGDTKIAFFYHKALQASEGNPVNEEDYRYPGPTPTTREAAIVMIADTVERLWDSGRDLEVTRVGERIGIVSLPTRTEGMEDYEACKKLLEELKNGTCKTNPSGAERGRASRISRLHDAPIFQKLPVTVMKLGEVFVVGFGGEPFTEYARALRRALPDTEIFTACCTNGDEGYLPTKEEFKMGGYEPASSPFPSDLQNHCVDMALDLIASLS